MRTLADIRRNHVVAALTSARWGVERGFAGQLPFRVDLSRLGAAIALWWMLAVITSDVQV
jgi:hypothetical protein